MQNLGIHDIPSLGGLNSNNQSTTAPSLSAFMSSTTSRSDAARVSITNAAAAAGGAAAANSSNSYFSSIARDSSVSYERNELDRRIRDAFRERQKQNKERQVQHLVLGKGLGTAAEETLREGYYNPRKVLEPLSKTERKMWDTINLAEIPRTTLGDTGAPEATNTGKKTVVPALEGATDDTTTTATNVSSSNVHFTSVVQGDLSENSSNTRDRDHSSLHGVFADEDLDLPSEPSDEFTSPFMEKLRCTYRPVNCIVEARMEVEENLKTIETELDALCTPFLFSEVLETLSKALLALERGVAKDEVALPMCVSEPPPLVPKERHEFMARERENPLLLQGPTHVLQYIREHVLPTAFEVLPVTHTAQWMVQYTLTFLRSVPAKDAEEAQMRIELLSRCVRILGETENYSSILLSLQSKAEEYDAFAILKESAEEHLGALLGEVEKTLEAVLACSFPMRRARLQLVDRGIRAKLQRALLFLNEIDYNWTPNVFFHAEWKLRFLSHAFYRLHMIVSPAFVKASLGFIDENLYKMVTDSRVSGKSNGLTLQQQQQQVPTVRQVEYERVVEGLTLQQIGMAVKGSASLIVGQQLCMGSRFVLRQCTPEYDEEWGFHMNEKLERPSSGEVQKMVTKIKTKARNKAMRGAARPPRSTTFLTQAGDDLDIRL